MTVELTNKDLLMADEASAAEPAYTAQELLDELAQELHESSGAADAGDDSRAVSTRTLHYYVNIGLLPGPEGYGRQARYSRDHLNRLKLIKRLQEAHLPLGVIKERLAALGPGQVARELAGLPALSDEPGSASPAPASAADYIARVLATQGRVRAAVRDDNPKPYAAGVGGQSSSDDEADEVPAEAHTWERIELAPGVELHLRRSGASKHRPAIDQLLAYARKLFQGRSK